jgi:hypothetical protein
MKHLKSFENYEQKGTKNESFLGGVIGDNIYDRETINRRKNSYIERASELVGKELTDKDVIPELRDYIENLLQQGNEKLADQLTDIKKEIERYEN